MLVWRACSSARELWRPGWAGSGQGPGRGLDLEFGFMVERREVVLLERVAVEAVV